MSITLFLDSDCNQPAGNVLFEGKKYFILFSDLNSQIIQNEIDKSKLGGFITWSKRNKVATLQIINQIGIIRLFDQTFDVRSEKFFEGNTGTRQFQLLLDDLIKLSRQIIFDYSSATSSYRTHRQDVGASVLERFNFYQQWFFKSKGTNSIEHYIELIICNPHQKLIKEYKEDFIWNIRQPTSKTMRSLLNHKNQLVKISNIHTKALTKSADIQTHHSKDLLLPLRAASTQNVTDHNTPENKFIKYLLSDIEQVCLSLIANINAPIKILKDCKTLLDSVRKLQRNPFFRSIDSLDYFPSSSPALISKHGYRELYQLFLRGRNGAQYLFEDIYQESTFIDLKDVSKLYEYWVFYRVAISLIGEIAVVNNRDVKVKDGHLANSIEISNTNIKIAFNKTYTRNENASYSLTLRPDICVILNSEEDEKLFILDAKYKSSEQNEKSDDDEPLPSIRVVKTADLHKMHCYIDAIKSVKAAIAIYPGNKSIFYSRNCKLPIANSFNMMTDLNGIGAAPLSPGSESNEFEALMKIIKNNIVQ